MKQGGGKSKGTRFELELARDIAKALGVNYGSDVRRTPASGALTTRSDLTLAPKHFPKFPFFLEAKHREGWDFWQYFNTDRWLPVQWYKEAEEKLKIDPYYDPMVTTVILVFKQNGKKPLVLLSLSDYLVWFPSSPSGTDFPWMTISNGSYYYAILPWSAFLAKVTSKE